MTFYYCCMTFSYISSNLKFPIRKCNYVFPHAMESYLRTEPSSTTVWFSSLQQIPPGLYLMYVTQSSGPDHSWKCTLQKEGQQHEHPLKVRFSDLFLVQRRNPLWFYFPAPYTVKIHTGVKCNKTLTEVVDCALHMSSLKG